MILVLISVDKNISHLPNWDWWLIECFTSDSSVLLYKQKQRCKCEVSCIKVNHTCITLILHAARGRQNHPTCDIMSDLYCANPVSSYRESNLTVNTCTQVTSNSSCWSSYCVLCCYGYPAIPVWKSNAFFPLKKCIISSEAVQECHHTYCLEFISSDDGIILMW